MTNSLDFRLRFVSAANIDDYSSGDSSFTTDDIVKPPSLRLPRRRSSRVGNASSLSGSDFNLSSSLPSDNTSYSMFRRGTLTHQAIHSVNSRAASCSDLLLEFEEEDEESDDQEIHKTHQLVSPNTNTV